jgi:nucleoside-diphosphate-sugar epimerase
MDISKILVTGFGFIGRHVVHALSTRGFTVTVLERKPDLKALTSLGAELAVGDVRDGDLMHELVPQFDGVINLAGLLGTAELISDPLLAVQTNIVGALNVFHGCKRARDFDHVPRCVHITVGNYFMDNSYSITKSTSERFAKMYNVEHNTDIRVVRVLNAYGEYQKHFPVRKIIPTFVRLALRNEPIYIYGDGNQVMDMIYVGDVAKILIEALLVEKVSGIISAGTGRRLTVNEIAQCVIANAGSTSSVEHCPMRPGEPERSVVVGDPATLAGVGVNVESLVAFEDGIRKTIDWYKANKEFIAV